MTDIDRLRDEFVDAMARTYEDDIEGERWEDARDSLYLASRRLNEAIDKPDRPEIGREFQLRHRDLSWNEMWIATASGIRGTDTGICHSWHDFDMNMADDSWEWRYPPQRIGWFTAYVYPRTEKDVRLRRELRENGLVYTESGRLVTHGLDPYIDIQWEGDERTYTEEEIRKAWIYSENVYSWKAFQRELRGNR